MHIRNPIVLLPQGDEGRWVEYIHPAKGYFIHHNEEIIIEVKIIFRFIDMLFIYSIFQERDKLFEKCKGTNKPMSK